MSRVMTALAAGALTLAFGVLAAPAASGSISVCDRYYCYKVGTSVLWSVNPAPPPLTTPPVT